jgi:hypothetical protein
MPPLRSSGGPGARVAAPALGVRFLLDQNISPDLARALTNLGHDAVHVRDLGMSRASPMSVANADGSVSDPHAYRCAVAALNRRSEATAHARLRVGKPGPPPHGRHGNGHRRHQHPALVGRSRRSRGADDLHLECCSSVCCASARHSSPCLRRWEQPARRGPNTPSPSRSPHHRCSSSPTASGNSGDRSREPAWDHLFCGTARYRDTREPPPDPARFTAGMRS